MALSSPAVADRPIYGVIVSWDECYREEVSQLKWGHPFTAVTDGYCLDQPFYHLFCIMPHYLSYSRNYWYVPQGKITIISEELSISSRILTYFIYPVETLEWHPLCVIGCHNIKRLVNLNDIGIFFEFFDVRRLRFVPNAQHKAHFPEDDEFALSWTERLVLEHGDILRHLSFLIH